MADFQKLDVSNLTEAEMVRSLSSTSQYLEKKFPDLKADAAAYQAKLTDPSPEGQTQRRQLLELYKANPELANNHLNHFKNLDMEPFTTESAKQILKTPFDLTERNAKYANGLILADMPYNLGNMSENEMRARMIRQSYNLEKKFPDLAEQAKDFRGIMRDDSAAAVEKRTKLLESYKTNPDLASKHLQKDGPNPISSAEAAGSFFKDTTLKLGGSPTSQGPAAGGNFFNNLFAGNGGGDFMSGLKNLFSKLGQMFTQFLGKLGIGGGGGGGTPTVGQPSPLPQPEKAIPKDELRIDRTMNPMLSASPKPEDGQVRRRAEISPAAKINETEPAQRADDKAGQTTSKADETPDEKKTAQADVAQQFEDIKAKFDLSPQQLDKLKTRDASVASADAEIPQASARISVGGPRV